MVFGDWQIRERQAAPGVFTQENYERNMVELE